MGQSVTCAPITQRARFQSPVGTSFLGEVFSGFFLTCKANVRKRSAPKVPEYHLAIIIIITHHSLRAPMTRDVDAPLTSNIHTYIHTYIHTCVARWSIVMGNFLILKFFSGFPDFLSKFYTFQSPLVMSFHILIYSFHVILHLIHVYRKWFVLRNHQCIIMSVGGRWSRAHTMCSSSGLKS